MSNPLNLAGAELFVPFPEGKAFLNAAYMTPEPRRSLDAMQRGVARLAAPDFGVEDFFDPPERVRQLLARVIGGDGGQFSLTGAVSFGIATLTWNLRLQPDALVGQRRRILGVDGQFPSNVQGWRRLEEVGFEIELIAGGPEASEGLLSKIDENTAVVAIEPISWVDGARLDLERIAAASKAAGARLVLDVTQCAGVDAPFSDDFHCDAIIGAGYKWLLGPYGTGFMRLSGELQELLEPLEASWKNFEGARDFNRLNEYCREPFSPAAQFDHGQSSAMLRLAGWEQGLEVLLELTPAAVREHTTRFAETLATQLDEQRYEVSPVASDHQAAHLFRIAPREASDFDAGTAQLAAAGVLVSQRDGGWRVSPHIYNGAADLERLVAALS